MQTNIITSDIIGCAIDIHKRFGPGLLEKAYSAFLCYDLCELGYYVEKEKPMPVVYKEVRIDLGYRTDMIVEEKVIIEIKRVERITDVHIAQILTYMKLGEYPLGLLINFQTKYLKDGIKRIVL